MIDSGGVCVFILSNKADYSLYPGRMKFLLKTIRTLQSAYTGKYAIVSNTVTAGTLGIIGDVLAQKSEAHFASKEWDMKRTRNMAIVCSCAGPFMHFWYKVLDRRFPGKSTRAVATKVLIDLLTGPLWYGWYIGGLSLLRGNSVKESVTEFKNKLPIVLMVDITLWPIFQGANFKFFAPQYRIVVLKCNELVFDVIFSHIANNEYTLGSLLEAISKYLSGKNGE